MKLTPEEIKGLAQLERDMDAGLQPYIVHQGARFAFPADALAHFGIETGQTVSGCILRALLEYQIKQYQSAIDRRLWPEEVTA